MTKTRKVALVPLKQCRQLIQAVRVGSNNDFGSACISAATDDEEFEAFDTFDFTQHKLPHKNHDCDCPPPYISLPLEQPPITTKPLRMSRSRLENGRIIIGKQHIIQTCSSACSCLRLVKVPVSTSLSNGNDTAAKKSEHKKRKYKHSFRPSSECLHCNKIQDWAIRFISSKMLSIQPEAKDEKGDGENAEKVDGSNGDKYGTRSSEKPKEPQSFLQAQRWRVELIGMNGNLVYINGIELKKGFENAILVGLGDEIFFRNPECRRSKAEKDCRMSNEGDREDYCLTFTVGLVLEKLGTKSRLDNKDREIENTVAVKNKSSTCTTERSRNGNNNCSKDAERAYCDKPGIPKIWDRERDVRGNSFPQQELPILAGKEYCHGITAFKGGEATVINTDLPAKDLSLSKYEHKEKRRDSNAESCIRPKSTSNRQNTRRTPSMKIRGNCPTATSDQMKSSTEASNDSKDLAKNTQNEETRKNINKVNHEAITSVSISEADLPAAQKCVGCEIIHNSSNVDQTVMLSVNSKKDKLSRDEFVDLMPFDRDSNDGIQILSSASLTSPGKDDGIGIENAKECENVVDLISPEAKVFEPLTDSLMARGDKSLVVDLVSDGSGPTTPLKQVNPLKQVPKYAAYFLPRGKTMSRNRIKIISQSLSRRDPNIIIQKNFNKSNVPKYIIVDAFLTLETVKSALGFNNLKQMRRLLEDVIFVKPDWVNQKGDLHSPTMDQCWTGGHELKKRKHDGTPSSQESGGWIKRIRKTHEFAPITKISAAEVNNPVIDYLYKRNMDKFQDIGFKNEKRNLPLSKLLKDISTIYKESPLQKFDDWRSYSYSRCAGRVQYLEFEVTLEKQSLDRLSKVNGFGAKVVKQCREFLATGECEIINEFSKDKLRKAMRNIIKIWGIGEAKASELVKMGYRNIKQVRAAVKNEELILSARQLIGVKFYEQFNEKMERHEVRQIGKIVEEAVKKRFPNAEVRTMGSYRRGAVQSGDVDVLIVDSKYTTTTPLGALDELVERLKAQGQVTHHLTFVDESYFKEMPTQSEDFHESMFPPYKDGYQSYMGVFASPLIKGKHRRLDIKFYPYRERAFAMLYFTGNMFFNRSIRLYAKRRKGMKLDDQGLFNMPKGSTSKGKRIKCNSEEEIFERLGLVYREPHERDGFDAVRTKVGDEVFQEDLTQEDVNMEKRELTKHGWID